ncbi:hypothetical protein [Tsukamurella pseudospumae]|uniref:hypothetical protein n=1 Tax=Tsukamurella pseudospumae TaxID=239498 RepID=UPI000ABEC227|nr:hypothetical protein [Tsukamurella pseudospumae]
MNGLTILGVIALIAILYLSVLELADAVRDARERRIAADRRRHPSVCARRRFGGAR